MHWLIYNGVIKYISRYRGSCSPVHNGQLATINYITLWGDCSPTPAPEQISLSCWAAVCKAARGFGKISHRHSRVWDCPSCSQGSAGSRKTQINRTVRPFEWNQCSWTSVRVLVSSHYLFPKVPILLQSESAQVHSLPLLCSMQINQKLRFCLPIYYRIMNCWHQELC